MKKFRLLSFLCLLVIGWGNAWSATYPKTWDFTTSNNTSGLTITHDGNASNWVYVSGTGYTVQRYVDVAITIPNVMYGNTINFDLGHVGGHSKNKYWRIECDGIVLDKSPNVTDGTESVVVGSKSVAIPNTVTTPKNVVLHLRGFNNADYIYISKIEVTRTPITFNVDNGNYIDNPAEQYPNRVDYKTQLQNGDVTIPVYNENNAFWTIDPRFKINGEDNFNINNLCDGTFDPSYFEVTYNTAGILSNEAIRADRSATVDGNTFNTRFRFRLSDVSRGTTSMTVTYKGSQGFEPFSKTINFNVEGIPCQLSDANMGNVYEKYIDDGQWNVMFRLRDLNNGVLNFNTNIQSTAKTVDDSGDEVASNVISLGTPRYVDNYLVVPITPGVLGTATVRIDYPGDATHEPAIFLFDVNIIQHLAKLEWVKTDENQNPIQPYVETDKWVTNQTNMYKYMPTLKKFKDNEENNSLAVTYESSNPSVASIDANGNITFHAAGLTVITARFVNNNYKDVENIHYYYYNDAAVSYTMILESVGTTANDPHIIWVTAGRFGTEDDLNYSSAWYGRNAAGSHLGQKWITTKSDKKATTIAQVLAQENYPFVGNYTGYGNNVFINAIALKNTVTDEQLEALHIHKIPGYKDHYYVIDDQDHLWWGNGGWRAHQRIPSDYFFDQSDPYQNKINYMVAQPAMVRSTANIPGNGGNNVGETSCPTKTYRLTPKYPSKDSLEVYAYIDGYGTYSTTKVLVNPGNLQLSFIPNNGTVNAGYSISPYVNCPDLRLEDVKKIWLTYDCPNTLNVPNNGVVYETGVTTHAQIAKYLTTVTANDTIWKNVDAKNYNDDGTPIVANIQELRPTTWLRGINPEIFGLATGIDKTCTVTIHLESEMYQTATADYDLTVVGDANTKTMFHFEMNDNDGNDAAPANYKTITMVEGDYIYMPGIIGNSNGNWDYSPANKYKYMYSISNGNIVMSYAKYFPGEGVPNYYMTDTFGGNPAIPQSGAATSQKAIITWSHGLGNYWRNDSLMIFGNKPGEMFLYAQDPQTKVTCTPIKIKIVSRDNLVAAKQSELRNMSYPFTWDFENMDMTKYIADADNANGNGGTYWREQWDEPSPQDRPKDRNYNRDYTKPNTYYQYNGGMNADWDDKDNNGTSRQRWFKDIYSYDGNGSIEYAPEFKGMMLNLAGLDYWEQKFQRFGISSDPDDKHIIFRGGPIFVQLPGFGLTQNKNGKLKTELLNTKENPGTRSYDNYIGGDYNKNANPEKNPWHNHINTAKFNVNENYTQMLSVTNQANRNVTYPVQDKYRNNKVRFVIKAKGNPNRPHSENEVPNDNNSSQFHIGGASMINEALDINDINWKQGIHNGYSYYNIDGNEAKVYIVELDPYDPELQDHIYLMFNNDVKVYWMAITNEPRDILSDFDGVTYSYPKDIDMEKTNLTLGMQTESGIYTKATSDGKYALASVGTYTNKNVYRVGTPDAEGKGKKVQLKAYKVSEFIPSSQSVTLSEIEGNLPKNEGVMLYTEPRMSELAGDPAGLEPAWYNRGNTAWSEWVEVNEDGKTVLKEVFHVAEAKDSTNNGNMYKNSHNYYYLPLYFIAMAENMSQANYDAKAPSSTGGGTFNNDEPVVTNKSVNRPGANLLRPVTYGKVLGMDYNNQSMINFGYNNEFICRKLVYQNGNVTKEMSDPYVPGPGNNPDANNHEGIYYWKIGPETAKFYRINTDGLNHHNRSAYLTLTWDEYKVNTVGKPINMATPAGDDPDSPVVNSYSPIRFSPSYNPVDILFDSEKPEEQLVSEDAGIPDGIDEVEHSAGDDKVYNLNGVRVNTLSKGIYIINGKKVVVK